MTCGIYKIYCKENNRTYIGSSNNIERRFKEHISNLKNNKHINNYLQNSWNKYGEDSFSFTIITVCYEQERFKLEQFYIDITKNLFNHVLQIENSYYKKRFVSEKTLNNMKESQNKRVWTKKHKDISSNTISKYRYLALQKTSKKIIVTIEGIQTEFPSINEASRILKIATKTIRKKLKGLETRNTKLKNIQIHYG